MFTLLFIIIVVGIILETVSLRRDPAKVELEYTISTYVSEPGAPFKVQSSVTNKSRIPLPYIAVREVYPSSANIPAGMAFRLRNDEVHVKKVCRVSGRRRKNLVLETSIRKRGVHLFKGDSIEFGDFLGFREFINTIARQQEVVVYPERLEDSGISDALGSYCGDIAARRFLIRDPILTVGIREYTGRESMKEIHWLQSAHRGELMVREFDYNRELSACVLMSVTGISASDEEGLDGCCAAARTVCESLVEKGTSVSFFTNAQLKRAGARDVWRCDVTRNHMGGLLEGLGRAMGYANVPFERLLDYAYRESDFDAAFIVILPVGDDKGEAAVNRLRQRTGKEVLVINMGKLSEHKPGAENARDAQGGQNALVVTGSQIPVGAGTDGAHAISGSTGEPSPRVPGSTGEPSPRVPRVTGEGVA